MQYSLRSLLVAFAVAGTGAAVFCACFAGPYAEPSAAAVGCVVAVLFCTTLISSVLGLKYKIRKGLWLVPPLLGIVALVPLAKWQLRQTMYANVMSAERACLQFAEAEEEYHKIDWNQDGVLEYTPSLKELCEKFGTAKSSVVIEQGIADAEWPSTKPFHGYFFKVFKSQRYPVSRSYLDENGRMTQGYALIAWPARYEWTGVHQMMISNSGTLYNAYLGDPEVQHGEKMTEFAPVAPYWAPD
jgi:hypothetical protein